MAKETRWKIVAFESVTGPSVPFHLATLKDDECVGRYMFGDDHGDMRSIYLTFTSLQQMRREGYRLAREMFVEKYGGQIRETAVYIPRIPVS